MPSVAVHPPKTPVTKGSMGIAAATIPNVCKMPGPPAPFVPTPLPNIGKSGDSPKGYSTTVKIEGNPVAIRGSTFGSMGDIASKGTGGGIVSNNTHGPTKFIAPGSMTVKIQGKNVQLLGDQTLNNCGPTGTPANSATLAGTVQGVATAAFADMVGDAAAADELCNAACKAMKKKLEPGQTRQNAMAQEFTGKGPLYTPSGSKILPEVSQVIPPKPGGGMTTLLSGTGRNVAGTSATAPMSMFKAMRASTPTSPVTRWDFVLPRNPSLPATNANIGRYIEVKFPGDSLTPNQQLARMRMSPAEREKIVEMDPARDCACK
jgi:uncharacterized Zn-binding protein involved in type VI secretion